jgi:hypothetical protein
VKESAILRLGDFHDEARVTVPDEFARRHGGAYLVHFGPIDELRQPVGLGETLTSERVGALEEKGPSLDPQADFLVFPVRRRSGRDLADADIWVGRTDDNDVIIPDASISIHHAVIRIMKRGEHQLLDVGSRNGTFVDDKPVPVAGRGEAVMLKPGDRVRFGSVSLSFLGASELHTLVNQLLGP